MNTNSAHGPHDESQNAGRMQPDGPVGRGATFNPANRFLPILSDPDYEQLEFDDDFLKELRRPRTVYLDDTSKSIVSENNSPDIPFRYSLNPYRGCLHGCSYCYARPFHEYLGMSAGLDFETRILVKRSAPVLFRDWLARPSYVCEPVIFSGVTDCYQPVERKLQITRQCLEVALEARQPVSLITKNALVRRDKELLSALAEMQLTRVAISITTLDQSLARVLEPACSSPAARLEAIRELTAAGVPVHAMVSPIIPGLTDTEVPAILKAVAESGARSAGSIMLRLPLSVEPIFLDWLRNHRPNLADKVEGRLRSIRGGALNNPQFHLRMRGSGIFAEQISALFRLHCRRLGLNNATVDFRTDLFRPPRTSSGQGFLF